MLKQVTFTGIDERAKPQHLELLAQDYPFLEFGFLVSKGNTGTGEKNRYPSLDVVDKLSGVKLNLSLHVCGSLARNIVRKGDFMPLLAFMDTSHSRLGKFKRVQLNVSGMENYDSSIRFPMVQDWIIQMKSTAPDMYRAYLECNNRGAHVLGFQDNSGGQGVLETTWMPAEAKYFGYAGGINEDNVESVIESIIAVNKGNPNASKNNPNPAAQEIDFWIDMESSVRKDDWFDVETCRRIAEKCAKYVNIEG